MTYSVLFWNLERFFASDVSALRAELAGGDPGEWTRADVSAKLDNLRTVLAAVHRQAPLALVGACEIETTTLVRRLGQALPHNLVSVDDVCEDPSGFALDGLNIGLLINRDLFDGRVEVSSHVLDRTFDTRDILQVTLHSSRLDQPLTVFVNHWASRLSAEGRERRVAASHYLRSGVREVLRLSTGELLNGSGQKVELPDDEALERRAEQPVIIMGDFNDEPFDPSLAILETTPDTEPVLEGLNIRGRSRLDRFRSYRESPLRLFNPYWRYASGVDGSYYRSPRWRIYDQILLSRGLLGHDAGDGDGNGAGSGNGARALRYVAGSARVFVDDALRRAADEPLSMATRTGKPRSFDRASGRGCSDHFPVTLQLDAPD